MLKSLALKVEYKDFFNSTDYLDIDSSDISYKITKITDNTIYQKKLQAKV